MKKSRRRLLKTCDNCGNRYDKTFIVTMNGTRHTFDSFECAIHALAPVCRHCSTRIVGHGIESEGVMFCCAHCATQAGVDGVVDRV